VAKVQETTAQETKVEEAKAEEPKAEEAKPDNKAGCKKFFPAVELTLMVPCDE
jgi:hypothetical protein